MRYKIKRKGNEIDAQLNTAAAWEDAGDSSVTGMTYEQGVAAAIKWLTGDTEEWPIQEEPDEGVGGRKANGANRPLWSRMVGGEDYGARQPIRRS